MFNVTFQMTQCRECGQKTDLVLGGHVFARTLLKPEGLHERAKIAIIAAHCRGCGKRVKPDKNGCYGEYRKDMGDIKTYSIYEYDGA